MKRMLLGAGACDCVFRFRTAAAAHRSTLHNSSHTPEGQNTQAGDAA